MGAQKFGGLVALFSITSHPARDAIQKLESLSWYLINTCHIFGPVKNFAIELIIPESLADAVVNEKAKQLENVRDESKYHSPVFGMAS